MRPLPSDLVNDWLARVVAAARGGLTPAAQRFAALGLMVISEGLEVLPEDPWAAPRLARGVGPIDGLLVRLSRPVDMLEQDGPPEHRVAALEMVARLAVQILAAPDLDGFHRPGGDVLLPQAPGPALAEPVNLSTPALGCTLGCEVEGCEQTFARPGPLGEFLSSVFKGGDEVDLSGLPPGWAPFRHDVTGQRGFLCPEHEGQVAGGGHVNLRGDGGHDHPEDVPALELDLPPEDVRSQLADYVAEHWGDDLRRLAAEVPDSPVLLHLLRRIRGEVAAHHPSCVLLPSHSPPCLGPEGERL